MIINVLSSSLDLPFAFFTFLNYEGTCCKCILLFLLWWYYSSLAFLWRKKKTCDKSFFQKNSGSFFLVTFLSFIHRCWATRTQIMAHSEAVWVLSPFILSCPPSLFVFFLFGATGMGVQSWLETLLCLVQHLLVECWDQLITDSLCSLSLHVCMKLCLCRWKKVEMRWEQSLFSPLMEVGLGWLGGNLWGICSGTA